MKKTIKIGLFSLFALLMPVLNIANLASANESQVNNFSTAIEKSTESISKHLDAGPTDVRVKEEAFAYLAKKALEVVFPVFIVAGVLVAMFGLYSLMTDPAKMQEGINMILYGTIGIIVLFSAKYLSSTLFTDIWQSGVGTSFSATGLLSNLYNKMVFPFLKLAIYFSLGALVIIMMTRVFTYITSQDESVKKKSMGVITWTTVGMLFIIGAKQLVEAIYGKQEKVLESGPSQLSDIGSQILNPKSIPIIFQVMNWALGLISLVLLVMIIFQTYKMLTNPDDESTFKSLKQTIVYAVLGLLLIGSAYILANLMILN